MADEEQVRFLKEQPPSRSGQYSHLHRAWLPTVGC
jgi:hypothetical protein